MAVPKSPLPAPSGNQAPLVPRSPLVKEVSLTNSLPPRHRRRRGEHRGWGARHSPSVATVPASKSRQSSRPRASSSTLPGPVGSSRVSSRSPLLSAMDTGHRREPGPGPARGRAASRSFTLRRAPEQRAPPRPPPPTPNPAALPGAGEVAPPPGRSDASRTPPSGKAGGCDQGRGPGQRGPQPLCAPGAHPG